MRMYAAKPRCRCCDSWWNWAGEARAAGKREADEGLAEYLDYPEAYWRSLQVEMAVTYSATTNRTNLELT